MAFGFLGNIAQTVGHDVSVVARGNSNLGGGVFGFLRTQLLPNDQQLQQKVQQAKQTVPQVVQSVTRTVPEAVTSLIPEQKTYTPGSSIEKAVFGSTPVQNIEAKVASNYDAHANLNPILRVGLAGAEGVGSVVQDAPVLGFLAKGTKLAGAGLKTYDAAQNEIGAVGKSVDGVVPPKPDDVHIQTPLGTVRIGADEMQALQKASTPTEVKAVIGDALPEQLTNKLAPALAGTKDPNIITNIISRELSPSPPAVSPDIVPTPVAQTADTAGQGTQDLSQQIISHLKDTPTTKGAISTREAQEAGYSAEREARLARSQAAGADLPGLEGHQAELTALGGALPKQEYSGLSHLAPEEQDNLFTQGRSQIKADENIKGYDKLNTAEALRKVIYGNGGVPTRSEISLLQRAFGGDFASEVQNNIHSTLGQKAFALWRAGLLTGPQTITKIITSHGVQEVLETLKDVPATAVDKFASLISGNRSLALTLKGKGKGFAQGSRAGKELLTTGIDRNPGTNSVEFRNQVQFGKHIPGKVAQAYVDFVGRAHGSLYKPFYGSAHLNSIYSTAIAGAKNQGLRGAERQAFVEDVVRNPSKEVLAIADHDAQMNSFQQQTALSQAAGALQKIPVIGKILAPFTRIPAAIATDLINYSPVGIPKTIFESIQAAKSTEGWTLADQRKLSQGLGRSITGSAAIIPGMMLYNKGIMTLGYPTDPKEQQLWAQEGKQPNSILIRGKWRSLGSLGPTGSVLEIGGHTADSLLQGKDIQSALVDGFAGGAQSIEEQSYLRGVSGAVSALNDPGRYAASFEKQTAGSIIPTASNTIANATDKFARQTTSPLDAIKSRIPGQRESLSVKLDTFGNPIPNSEVGADRIIDPFQSSTAAPSNPLSNELRRLQNAGQGIVPSPIKKVESFNGVKTPLTPQQVRTLQSAIGQQTEQAWNQIVNDPGYKDLPDDQKKQLLTKYYDEAVTEQKQQFAEQIQGGIFSPNYSTNKTQSKVGRPYVFQ